MGAARPAGANERTRLGCIGLGNRGDQVLDAFLKQPDAEVIGKAVDCAGVLNPSPPGAG